jgi:hypothetical protein
MTDALASVSANRGIRGSHDERRLTAHWPAKPAPDEVVTLASLPPGTLFRLVRDYEGVKEAFADRAEDLGVALTEIDAAGGMTRGNAQKLISNSNAKWARQFGFVSLEKMLKGTGLMLAFVIDDERFAAVKATMVKRKVKQKRTHKLLPSSPA